MGLSAGVLHQSIAKVAPIKSVRLKGDVAEIVFEDGATDAERSSASSLLKKMTENPVERVEPLNEDEIRALRDLLKQRAIEGKVTLSN